MSDVLLIGWYYNYQSSAEVKWTYFQNTSYIEVKGQRISISVDVENHSAQYVIQDLA